MEAVAFILPVMLLGASLCLLTVSLDCLAMDQKQCFDRLDLAQLERVAVVVGMPLPGIRALGLYRHLKRHLFLDGQPIGHIICGPNQRGIPQGCPLSVHWRNLTCWLWQLRLREDCPRLDVASFLDDRLLSSECIHDLDVGLGSTASVDAAFGAELNVRKTKWATTSLSPASPGPLLTACALVAHIKNQANDVIVRGHPRTAPRPRVVARCALGHTRVALISLLHAARRGNLVVDSISGLYVVGGAVC
jgi:hypothetical protein